MTVSPGARLGQRGDPSLFFEHLQLLGEVDGRDGQSLGIGVEIDDAVVQQDQGPACAHGSGGFRTLAATMSGNSSSWSSRSRLLISSALMP